MQAAPEQIAHGLAASLLVHGCGFVSEADVAGERLLSNLFDQRLNMPVLSLRNLGYEMKFRLTSLVKVAEPVLPDAACIRGLTAKVLAIPGFKDEVAEWQRRYRLNEINIPRMATAYGTARGVVLGSALSFGAYVGGGGLLYEGTVCAAVALAFGAFSRFQHKARLQEGLAAFAQSGMDSLHAQAAPVVISEWIKAAGEPGQLQAKINSRYYNEPVTVFIPSDPQNDGCELPRAMLDKAVEDGTKRRLNVLPFRVTVLQRGLADSTNIDIIAHYKPRVGNGIPPRRGSGGDPRIKSAWGVARPLGV